MLESLDSGLAILQYSKHHAEHVVPCKETGMVYYIEVNLLTQKYEKEPDSDLKMKILKTAELAISQFTGEEEAVQKDYQRMLMLKMVFCRLGIGLFGNKIENVVSDDSDQDAAKDYLDFIERPGIWNGMEKRRKMLFQVAKSELYRQRKQYELAIPHAKEAVRIAEENNWHAESPNFKRRLEQLEDEMKVARSQPSAPKERDYVDQWLDEFDDDDYSLEMEELKLDVHENRANTEHSFLQSTVLRNNRTNENMVQMDFLKGHGDEPVEVNAVNTVRMNNLKCLSGIQETCYNSETTYSCKMTQPIVHDTTDST